MARQSLGGLGLLIIEASRSHSDTPHSVGLLWTSDQPVAETSTWQHKTLTTDRYTWPRWDSFYPVPFFPYLNPFVLHVTLRSILPSLQQTQHKHPCPRWDSLFFCLFGVFPFDPFLYCLNPFVLHVTLRSILPSLTNTTQTSMLPVGFEPAIPVSEPRRPTP
jgi:hypothetical protein